MRERDRIGQATLEHGPGDLLCVVVPLPAGEDGLDHLEVSVTELVPEKAVERLRGLVEPELSQVTVHVRRRRRQARENPSVRQRQRAAEESLGAGLAFQLRQREPGGVPQLGGEAPRAGEPFPVEGHRRARGRRARVGEAQRIRSELFDRHERVDDVAAGLRHLFPRQADEPVQVHRGERD